MDGIPKRRNEAVFSYFFGVVSTRINGSARELSIFVPSYPSPTQ